MDDMEIALQILIKALDGGMVKIPGGAMSADAIKERAKENAEFLGELYGVLANGVVKARLAARQALR